LILKKITLAHLGWYYNWYYNSTALGAHFAEQGRPPGAEIGNSRKRPAAIRARLIAR